MITKRNFILRGSCFCEKYVFLAAQFPELNLKLLSDNLKLLSDNQISTVSLIEDGYCNDTTFYGTSSMAALIAAASQVSFKFNTNVSVLRTCLLRTYTLRTSILRTCILQTCILRSYAFRLYTLRTCILRIFALWAYTSLSFIKIYAIKINFCFIG